MKRKLAIIIALGLILLCIVAIADACVHPNLKAITTTSYSKLNSSYHNKVTSTYHECPDCGYESAPTSTVVSELHYEECTGDYHSGSSHHYYYQCIRCGQTRTMIRECDGPPCANVQ